MYNVFVVCMSEKTGIKMTKIAFQHQILSCVHPGEAVLLITNSLEGAGAGKIWRVPCAIRAF